MKISKLRAGSINLLESVMSGASHIKESQWGRKKYVTLKSADLGKVKTSLQLIKGLTGEIALRSLVQTQIVLVNLELNRRIKKHERRLKKARP